MEYFKVSETDFQLAKFLKAIGNPIRISIIKKLIEKSNCPHGCNPCSCGDRCEGKNCKCGCKCGELVELFAMSQSTISQHIKELKEAGLIETTGRKGDYILNHQKLKESMDKLLDELQYKSDTETSIKTGHCCCTSFIEK